MKKILSLLLIFSFVFICPANAASFKYPKNINSSFEPFSHIKQYNYTPTPASSYDAESPMIALTFDDGPSKYATDDILDILEEYNAKATFFVLGMNVEAYPDKLERAVELGCEIGNHTYDHQNLSKLSKEKVEYQIDTTKWCVYEACGTIPTLVRPPYGIQNDYVRKASTGPIVLWSIDTLDWENRNTETIIKRVLDRAKDGDIVLMHDIYSFTAKACETIIPELIERGFQLVTVSELLEAKGVITANGETVTKAR